MQTIYDVEKVVEKELCEIVDKGSIESDEWDNLGKAIDVLKDIATIKSMESFDDAREYSRAYEPEVRMPEWDRRSGYRSRRGNSYADDMHDSRGSREYATSGSNEHTIRMLEEKMEMTSDPNKRRSLSETIELLKHER